MAKRKTIRINPLDTLVSDPTASRTGESHAAAKAQSAGPTASVARTTTPGSQPKVKDGDAPAQAAKVTQLPSPADLVRRIQSLEQQNVYLGWLVGGAILLAVLL
jgi:hypothetical protein